MTVVEFKSEEEYERVKNDWLYHLELHINEGWDLDALDVVEVLNLLKQSKWIRAYPTDTDIEALKLIAYADGYEDCERYNEDGESND